jgi:hypothetical protein
MLSDVPSDRVDCCALNTVQPRLGVLRGHGDIIIAAARGAVPSEASCRSKWSRCLMKSDLSFMRSRQGCDWEGSACFIFELLYSGSPMQNLSGLMT